MFVMEKIIITICKLSELKTHTKTFQRIKINRITNVIRAFQHTSNYYKKTVTLVKNLRRKYKKVQYGQKYHLYYPLYRLKIKMVHLVGKFMLRSGIKGYNILITGAK